MSDVLKAVSGFSAVAGLIGLLTGQEGFVGKFSEIFFLIVAAYMAILPITAVVLLLASAAEKSETLSEMSTGQVALIVGVIALTFAIIVRQVVLTDAQPNSGAAAAGAVLLAIPFLLVAYRSLGRTPPSSNPSA